MIISFKKLQYALIALVVLAMFLPSVASAYFSSDAGATINEFSIGTLEIDVDNTGHNVDIDSSTGDNFSFNTSDIGSIAPQYRLVANPVACTDNFFNGLDIEVEQGVEKYNGKLSALLATSTVAGKWDINISPDSPIASNGQQCIVQILVQAWQNEFPLWNSKGFSDEVAVTVTITATEDIGQQPTISVVLNEIYPNPDTSTTTIPLEREWIELYNGTGSSEDVIGWKVNGHTIVSSCTGGSNEMQPYAGASTNIGSGGLLVIEFCNNGANNKLTNSGMLLELFDNSLTLQDSYTYPNTPQLKSHARIPDGGSWVDPIPSPGVSNLSTVTEEDLEAEGWTEEMIEAVLGSKPIEIVEVNLPLEPKNESIQNNDDTPPVSEEDENEVPDEGSGGSDDDTEEAPIIDENLDPEEEVETKTEEGEEESDSSEDSKTVDNKENSESEDDLDNKKPEVIEKTEEKPLVEESSDNNASENSDI